MTRLLTKNHTICPCLKWGPMTTERYINTTPLT